MIEKHMTDSAANKWIKSAAVSLDALDKLCKWHRTQRGKFLVQVDDLEKEVERLREVILDFSLPMWNYLNSQVHPDQEGFTSNAVKSLVKNTPYESLMHLWEDACGYLPDPDCDDTLRNKPVWNREMIE
tara:strand:- start:288 stop:674 length:387 start_codon:yes stop_codon:yes gene_type:complete